MQIVQIDHRNALLEDVGRKIVVRSNGHRKATIPMRRVERLVVTSSAKLETSLLAKLNEQGTGVLIMPARFKNLGPVHIFPAKSDIALAQAQMRVAENPATALALAGGFLDAKLRGHRLLLVELAMRFPRHRQDLESAAAALGNTLERLAQPIESLSVMHGIEGSASARFFRSWGKCFPAALKFKSRNRRPPLDPVNVCLSIGYTLAHHEALAAACKFGLEPHTGFLHEPQAGRDSLASDIVETVRPVIDRWVLDLFRLGHLTAGHFSTTATSCLAGKTARKLIYEHYFETTSDMVTQICTHHAVRLREQVARHCQPQATIATPEIKVLDE